MVSRRRHRNNRQQQNDMTDTIAGSQQIRKSPFTCRRDQNTTHLSYSFPFYRMLGSGHVRCSISFEMKVYPLPWVPWGRLGNLRTSGLLAASPGFQKVPAPPSAAPLQGFWGCFGPRASKCVTTHHDAFPRGGSLYPLAAPRPCLLYTSPSPRDATLSRMPSSA